MNSTKDTTDTEVSLNNVHRTTDYKKFKFLKSNREQGRHHVEDLKTAFQEIGNFTRVQPILVNEKFEIIDGQHRFTACKELNLPIYFTQMPGLGVTEARTMNILHKSWKVIDYAKSYAETGDVNYKTYLQLREDYGFNHSIVLSYIYNVSVRGGTFKSKGGISPYTLFREGGLHIEDEAAVRERLDKLAAASEIVGQKNKDWAEAVRKLINSENIDFDRFLRKLESQKSALANTLGTLHDYLRVVEDIYNFKINEENRVRLF